MAIKRVKVDGDNQNGRPEESPLVSSGREEGRTKKEVGKIREDYEAADRLKQHLASDRRKISQGMQKVIVRTILI